MADALGELERDLNAYVAFWHRRGRSEYVLSDALKEHRRQVLANLRDDGDETWLGRNGLLEQLAELRHISLAGEPSAASVLDYRRHLSADRRKAASS